MITDLEAESKRATEMLKGKVVLSIVRHRAKEVCVMFTDGTRLYLDYAAEEIELSITGGGGEDGVEEAS